MDIAAWGRDRAAAVIRRRAGRRLRVVFAASVVVVLALLMAGPAPAQTQVYLGVPPPTVPYQEPPTTLLYHPPQPNRAPVRLLALTGSDLAGLCMLAFGALGGGVVLTRLGRSARAFGGPSLLER